MNSPKKSSISSLNLALLTLPIFLLISLFILFPSPKNAIDHPSKANVFVTFHIRNEQILENVRQIQRTLFQANPKYLRHFQPIPSLHVTLILCALNASNFGRAKEALDAAALKFAKEYSPVKFVVHFEGIQHFGNSTLFGALQNQSFLQTSKLFDLVKTEFEERGMPALGQFPVYHPHMSLVDLGAGEKAEWLAKYWPKIEAEWREREIGAENVKKIQICSMDLDEWSQDYKVLYEVGLKD